MSPLPFSLDLRVPDSGAFYLRLESGSSDPESIEAAEEFISALFAPAVNAQLFNPSPRQTRQRFVLQHSAFDANRSCQLMRFEIDQVPDHAYAVLLALLSQATQLEEPLLAVEGRPRGGSARLLDADTVVAAFEGLIASPPPLPFAFHEADDLIMEEGAEVRFDFVDPIAESALAPLLEQLVLWDNLYFTHGFNFAFADQTPHYPEADVVSQEGPRSVVLPLGPVDYDPCSGVALLLNIALGQHAAGRRIESLEIE